MRYFVFFLSFVTGSLAYGSEKNQISYLTTVEIQQSDCSNSFKLPDQLLLVLENTNQQQKIYFPQIQPEHIVLGPSFQSGKPRVDRLPAESIGYLNFHKLLTVEFNDALSSVTGNLRFSNKPELRKDIPDDQKADADLLANSGCSLKASLRGQKVTDTTPPDAGYVEQIWDLLHKHTEHVTSMDPDASMPPLLEGLKIKGPHQIEFLWRLSRAWFLKGEQLPNDAKSRRLEAFKNGINYASQGLAVDPKSGEAAFFLAANTGRYNTTKGLIKTLTGLDEFEALCYQSIDQGSTYNLLGYTVIGDAHHALGQFYRLVPDSGFLKFLAGTKGDIDKSIKHHKLSIEQQPDRGDYLKELAVSLLCQADRQNKPEAIDQAKLVISRAMTTPTWAFDNPELDKWHLQKLLELPDKACGYSRDNFH